MDEHLVDRVLVDAVPRLERRCDAEEEVLDARSAVGRRHRLDPRIAAEHDLVGETLAEKLLERDEPLLVGRVLEVREIELLAERVVLEDSSGGGDLAVVPEVQPLVQVAEDHPVGRLAAVGQHLEDLERVGAARVEVDVHHRPGPCPGAAGGADHALLAGGDRARRADLADQRGAEARCRRSRRRGRGS